MQCMGGAIGLVTPVLLTWYFDMKAESTAMQNAPKHCTPACAVQKALASQVNGSNLKLSGRVAKWSRMYCSREHALSSGATLDEAVHA
jgi:hypothetical protein